MFRRIRKRPYRGPGRRWFRRKPLARAVGSYELLYTDIPDNAAPGLATGTIAVPNRTLFFRNESFGDPHFCVLGSQGASGSPADVTGADTATFNVLVDEVAGFTNLIPLWDNELAAEWDDSASLLSLKGWMMPVGVQLSQNNTLDDTLNQVIARVRLEILPLRVNSLAALVGGSDLVKQPHRVEEFISFSRLAQKKRIWWQREWNVPFNSQRPFDYWVDDTSPNVPTATREPLLAGLCGGPRVSLKPNMRIGREVWPFLAVSVAASWAQVAGITGNPVVKLPAGGGGAGAASFQVLNADAGKAVSLAVSITGRLRAYLRK